MNEDIWDVVVIGGGPSGMMAAGRAAELGSRVLVIEKNDTLGKKLLITGGGRCNVTNAEFNNRILLEKFKENGKFLFSAFSQWSTKDTIDFLHTRGLQTKVENEKRVFPITDKAQSVWDVMVSYMKEHNVTVLSDSPVGGFVVEKNDAGEKSCAKISGVILKNKTIIHGSHIILATGGTSRPETGSTGDGYKWLSSIGHTVIQPEPSLVPIATKEKWVEQLSGVTLQNVKITLLQNNQKQEVVKGKVLFTHIGLSGPTILNLSSQVADLLKYGEVFISIDLLPHLDYGQLNTALQDLFKEHDKKKFKNALSDLIPSALAPIIVEKSGIDPELQCNSITREKRLELITLLKDIRIQVSHLLGTDKAIISSGGVTLDEVDFKTMRSRLYDNLYIIGDVLNIDRPSGGYSLQLCWTTGFVAGSAAGALEQKKDR